MSQAKEETEHCAIFIQRHRDLEISPWRGKTLSDLWVIHTSAALLPVLGPSLSNTLGLRDGAAGLVLLLVVVLLLLLLSDMVFEFSTVTFRLILDILQDCKYDKQRPCLQLGTLEKNDLKRKQNKKTKQVWQETFFAVRFPQTP